MPIQYKTFKTLITKANTYKDAVNTFKTELQKARNKYNELRKEGGEFVKEGGGLRAGETDAEFKAVNKEAKDAFNTVMKAQRAFFTKTNLKIDFKNNPVIEKLFKGEVITGDDIEDVYQDDYRRDEGRDSVVSILQTMKDAKYNIPPPLKGDFYGKKDEDGPYYDKTFKPSTENIDKSFDDLYNGKGILRTLTGPTPPAPAPEDEEEDEESEQEGGPPKDDKQQTKDGDKTQAEIDEEDAKKLAEEAKEAEAKAEAKAKADIAKANKEQEKAQVAATLKEQAEGGRVPLKATPTEPEKTFVETTTQPRPEDNTVVVEQGRNELTPDQAMKMSTLDISKEEKEVDDMPIKEVRKRIDALHVLYQDVIKLFQTDAHKKDREQSKKNDSKARNHLKMMLKAVREYYRESSSMQVGVIIPAHQLVASIMSKIGMQMPTGGMSGASASGAPPPPPPPSQAESKDEPPAQAEGKDDEPAQGKDEDKGDDEDEEKETEKPTASTASASTASQKGGVGSVKEHAGDKLKKTGDRFGHGFHVSVNYRNSGMEAYQRRAVGRHVLKDDVDERQGMLADPQPQLNQPALARYIQKIPGFKG